MNVFIFFALPLATILLAIVLQKVLRSPVLVAITFFAIYLIIAFVAFQDTLAEAIIATITYTIIAYVTAYIVMLICRLKNRFDHCTSREDAQSERRCCYDNNNDDDINENTENNLLRISCSCGSSDRSNDLLTVDSTCFANNSNNRVTSGILEDSNVITNNHYVNRPVAYRNRKCYRRA